MIVPYGFVAWKRMTLRVRRDVLLKCLAFSAPLVPYAVSGWTMDLSNRYLVEYFMGLEDVGRYNAAYQFALIMQAILNAFALAWIPVFYQLVKEDDAEKRLAVEAEVASVIDIGVTCHGILPGDPSGAGAPPFRF